MDPVAFTLFGIPIMWYGVLITTGVCLAIYTSLLQIDESRGLTKEKFVDIAMLTVMAGILGARLYYVIFFNLEYYLSNPMQILNFRQGGLAIHGGIIGGGLMLYYLLRRNNVKFFYISDIVVPGLALAQSIGRWGNFINQEAHGGPTDLPWGIMVDGIKVHPTFLYESIPNFLLFLYLFFYKRKHKEFEGELTSIYLIVYGIVRFFIERLRTDSLMLGPIRVAQLVSILMILAGVFINIKGKRKTK